MRIALALTIVLAIPGAALAAEALHVESFDTLHGTVTVNLPADLAAGDTITGTVVAEPEGKDETERATNRGELSGLVVEIEEQQAPAKDGQGRWLLPAAATAVALVLRDASGNEIARRSVPVAKTPPLATATGYATPALAQSGTPLVVQGAFDGDGSTTALRAGGRALRVLAESPRAVVAEIPAGLTGLAQVEVAESGRDVARCSVRNVGVSLSAGKTDLKRGERTKMTVVVTGLEGIERPLSLDLRNNSPGVVRLEGGAEQILTIEPKQARGGSYRTTRSLTGIVPGGFGISATPLGGRSRACTPVR